MEKLDAETQSANPTDTKFPMANHKIRKKRLFRYLFYQ